MQLQKNDNHNNNNDNAITTYFCTQLELELN